MKKSIKLLIAMLMPLAFVACSSDNDEPEQNNTTDKEMYDHLISNICDSDGKIVFGASEKDPSKRGLAVEDGEEAKEFCKILMKESWDGKKKTLSLSDGLGSLTVNPSEEAGVFNTISFNLKDIVPFTLIIAQKEYFENENAFFTKLTTKQIKSYTCKNCGYYVNREKSKYPPHPCPECGKDNWQTNYGRCFL